MPMIRRADAATLARDAVVLDLGDLARQGRELVERAEAEAQRIVEGAQAERERLITGASERGYADGLERGRDQGRAEGFEAGKADAVASQAAEIERLREAWERALHGFEAMRSGLQLEAERGVLAFAVKLGERVAKRAIDADAEAAARQLAEAIDLTLSPSRLRVRVSPVDAQAVRAVLPALSERFHESASASVVEDESLSHGSVVLEADDTLIDATIETQLSRIVQSLLPGGSS